MSDTVRPSSNGPSRRTVLKATAWSLPVVAVAAATPLAAASTTGDLLLTARTGGTTIGANDPGATEAYVLAIPPGFDVTTIGTERTPAGATLIVTFDSRLLGDPSATMDGINAPRTPVTIDGNVATATFTLPLGIPANGTTEPLLITFATISNGVWVTDAQPYTVTLVAPAGSPDPDTGNNTVTVAAEYSPVVPI